VRHRSTLRRNCDDVPTAVKERSAAIVESATFALMQSRHIGRSMIISAMRADLSGMALRLTSGRRKTSQSSEPVTAPAAIERASDVRSAFQP
jgi:hypothetical protein